MGKKSENSICNQKHEESYVTKSTIKNVPAKAQTAAEDVSNNTHDTNGDVSLKKNEFAKKAYFPTFPDESKEVSNQESYRFQTVTSSAAGQAQQACFSRDFRLFEATAQAFSHLASHINNYRSAQGDLKTLFRFQQRRSRTRFSSGSFTCMVDSYLMFLNQNK